MGGRAAKKDVADKVFIWGIKKRKRLHVSVPFTSAEIQNANETNSVHLSGLTNQNKPFAQHNGGCLASVCSFSTAQAPWSEEDREAEDGVVGGGR